MKFFSSEFLKDYDSYTFSYANYAQWEEGDDFSPIYERGFLPYTGDTSIKDTVFYMARGVRIRLDDFSPTSENRRVLRKFEDVDIAHEIVVAADFDDQDSSFLDMALGHAQQRFSNDSMDEVRLSYVLSKATATHIMRYTDQGKPIAYVLLCMDRDIAHYWFAFFDTSWLERLPLGKWIMLQTILRCQQIGKKHIYLGTCYGTKSLYKVRDFNGVEFFDGQRWNPDTKLLKAWCKAEETETLHQDRFKAEAKDDLS